MIDEAKKYVLGLAEKNKVLDWFFEIHQKEIELSAKKLLESYPEANKDVVLLACWLHDIAHYTAKTEEEIIAVKKDHHLLGAELAEEFLKKHQISKDMISKIKDCIKAHRNTPEYPLKSIEEKIVAVADSLSHFQSVFYFTYFKVHPNRNIAEMVKAQLEKLERDWRDVQILPEAAKIAKPRYQVLKEMLENYNK